MDMKSRTYVFKSRFVLFFRSIATLLKEQFINSVVAVVGERLKFCMIFMQNLIPTDCVLLRGIAKQHVIHEVSPNDCPIERDICK